MMISYGDSIISSTIHRYKAYTVSEKKARRRDQRVHLLPFFPFSSDDGFSVIDYLKVNPSSETGRIFASEDFKLMGDLVINHCSSQHAWFQNYLKGSRQELATLLNPSQTLSMLRSSVRERHLSLPK